MTASAAAGREPARHFCTYFDRNYLARGLVLLDSLRRHSADARLWVLCLDRSTRESLERLDPPGIELLDLEELEAADPALTAVKPERSRIEYYFTMTPALVRHVLGRLDPGEWLLYVDADLYFFSDPDPLYDELAGASIGIIEHRFPERLSWHADVYGRFNVGLVAFRHDAAGTACLDRWRAQCLEWCYDRIEDGRYADQKYLDEWPSLYPETRVLRHPGVGLAPWSWSNYAWTFEDATAFVDGEPAVFFHFHGMRAITEWLYDLNAAAFPRMPLRLQRRLYGVYIAALRRKLEDVRARLGAGYMGEWGARVPQRWTRFASHLLRGRLYPAVGPLRVDAPPEP